MGLPQELIDHIAYMLCDDLPALKACSLTCKAMFASTRRLIHQILCLPALHAPTGAEMPRPQGRKSSSAEFRILSYKTECGLLQYAQWVHIDLAYHSRQRTAPLHNHLLQSLDQVHTLSIEKYRPSVWVPYFQPYCTNFYPTVTSLALTRPTASYGHILQFALQFPMLQNLCIEWLIREHIAPNPAAPTTARQSPSLGGHLRLVGVDTVAKWPVGLIHKHLDGINFRSVELEDFSGDDAQHILDMCAHTLQSLTIVPYWTGTDRSLTPSVSYSETIA